MAVLGSRVWTLAVCRCPMCVESIVVPLGRRTVMGDDAGLAFCMWVLCVWPKWWVHPVSAIRVRGVVVVSAWAAVQGEIVHGFGIGMVGSVGSSLESDLEPLDV